MKVTPNVVSYGEVFNYSISVNSLNKNDNILIKLYNGEVNANIIDIKENKND